ncbi:hypothetical protein GCM10010156_28330 [Planobispora rosea]|uniref:DUF4192 domain-containing protein n=1 Tax=Planobispora rosea TaxID=35762 RepID=A0A8J3S197_PLARO|nr:DUF4192 domain-containing protein [Planobispora rosea]GGS67682.1 hypothetical protein GCM10010156_28330 [Planobispora rosea]GIH85193.1 hypothetical protein Pro02_36010 [Planobispora rosea]
MTTDIPAQCPGLLLGSTEDLLGAVPYLLGFHPADSLVVIGLRGAPPRARLHLTARWDLPLAVPEVDRVVSLLGKEEITRAVVVGYGRGPLVTPAADAVITSLREERIALLDVLRVEDGRYWSYLCSRADCCPPSGTPYDRESGVIAAQATVHGLTALPDRAALERSLAPLEGPERAAMGRATARVLEGLRIRLAECEDADRFAGEFVAGGIARVREALEVYASGGRLDDEQAARLGLDLAMIRVRDEAWALIAGKDRDVHHRLWRDLTRRLEPEFAAPAASLLAMTAWCQGDSALAGMALARARDADSGYSMANLLTQALRRMLPPQALNDRMPSPEELDEEMGAPRASWLLPVTAFLGEAPPDAIALAG